ncbi:hypothetical protein [Streptomyces cylindrosporus]|uniref:Uncharacterized protein n=1 Tax=Streptomyces cylindrosporus TaxID=2927583 RepID=A0ABS9YK18_9ACTN|nr:hypothetical protein [Streptomyces cylindrosporus]MCI3277613.1 hypothetical protein [Streptomyces cylindrosporus]
MGWLLERRLKAINPHAANPSTTERDRAERKERRRARVSSVRRALVSSRREPKVRWRS